ncbi:hypothetical protein F2P81_013754 [Scophthalmus maximus]|uniref:Uncharacterized protein n=1 Tax=Scophthalmus maximus TaxID=52904 RepID=A0A6A4SNE7_SCOMX|nr:hypothetical protein F2P81_013754 [Scophthalmus maximus]
MFRRWDVGGEGKEEIGPPGVPLIRLSYGQLHAHECTVRTYDTVKAVVCFEMLAINIRDRPPEEVPRFLIFDSTVERLIRFKLNQKSATTANRRNKRTPVSS